MGPLLTSKHFWPHEFSICWAVRMDSDFLLFVLYQGTRGTTSFKTHFWALQWGASPEPPPARKGTASHHSKRELFTLVRQFWRWPFPLKSLKGPSFPRCTDPWNLSNTGNQGKFTIVCNSVFLSTGGNATLGFERGKKKTILAVLTASASNGLTGGSLVIMIPASPPPSQGDILLRTTQQNKWDQKIRMSNKAKRRDAQHKITLPFWGAM